MKQYAWFLVIPLLFVCKSYAQHQDKNENNIPVALIVHDSLPGEFNRDISKQVIVCNASAFEHFEKTGKLEELQNQTSANSLKKLLFEPVNEITFLFAVYNGSRSEKTIYFETGDADLVKLSNVSAPHQPVLYGGFLGSSNRISPFSPNNYLPVKLAPAATSVFLCYAKFAGSYKEQLLPRLLSEKTYQLNSIRKIDEQRIQLVYHSFLLGGFLIISIFMFAQYFFNKDKAYLYYAAYGLCIFLISEKIMEASCNINLVSYFFPYYIFSSHVILQLLASFFYIDFLKQLLGISRQNKPLFLYIKAARLLILLGCILYFATFFFKDTSAFVSVIYNYGAFVSTLVMLPLLVLLFLLKKKDLAVKFLIAGFSIVVIAALAVVYINKSGLYVTSGLPSPVFIIELGVFMEMIFFGLALGYKTQRQKREKQQIEQQITEIELVALKAQMNPHFIFNCINSIDAFIHSNDKYNATLYLNKFAKLLRNILDSSRQNTVAFSKDIETLKLYIELEELRHEKKFTTTISIDDELLTGSYKVPPLIIQPFVENAILHGLKNREDNNGLLQISIKRMADTIEYCITDNGIGREAAALVAQTKESSYGMQMSFDRIRLFNKEEKASVIITDLYQNGMAAGTAAKISLKIV